VQQETELSQTDRPSAAHTICREHSVTLKSGLDVTQGHWKWAIRYIAYQFLLAFRSNYGAIYCVVCENIGPRSRIFYIPPAFSAPAWRTDRTPISMSRVSIAVTFWHNDTKSLILHTQLSFNATARDISCEFMYDLYILSYVIFVRSSFITPKAQSKSYNITSNKNLAIANGSRVSCAHNMSRASIGLITHDLENLGQGSLKVTGNGTIG